MELKWTSPHKWGNGNDDSPTGQSPEELAPLRWPVEALADPLALRPPVADSNGTGTATNHNGHVDAPEPVPLWGQEPGRGLEPGPMPATGTGAEPEPEDDGAHELRLVWLRTISFRSRVTVLVAAAVGVAVALVALSSYIAVSHQLEGQASRDLKGDVDQVPVQNFLGAISPGIFINLGLRTGDQVQVVERVTTAGSSAQSMQIYSVGYQAGLPALLDTTIFKLTPAAKKTYGSSQTGAPGNIYYTVQTETGADGQHYLVATIPVNAGQFAVQLGYPLTDMDNTLGFLRLMLILVALSGVALAATLGWAVGRASMRPVEELTLAAEHVAETQDLSATIDDTGKDELSRLARSFNAMLSALSSSQSQQAQLVSDAGHELRTPLTSLRTNIEFLIRAKDLAGPDRDELLADVDAQLTELTTLVGDLVDMARGDERPQVDPVPVPFNEVVERAVERAQRRAMSVHFDVSLQPGEVLAQPALLERAVMNVLDNAAKWSPAGGHVGVDLEANSAWHLTVTDQGPGIAPEDLPHIFDRFYRAPSARSMPGSGLGLAIVKGVVTSHGGTIEIGGAPGGGTKVDIVLPLAASAGTAADDGPGADI